jgi:hypothetical protein
MTRQRRTDSQLELFESIGAFARSATGQPRRASNPMGCDDDLRAALVEAIRSSNKTRDGIAADMAALLGEPITRAQIDAWTASTKKGHRFPAAYLPALCEATGDRRPLDLLAAIAGVWVGSAEDRLLAERGRILKEEESLRRRKRLLRAALDVAEGGA